MVFLQSARPAANPFQADPTANLFVITHPKIAEHHPYSLCRLTIADADLTIFSIASHCIGLCIWAQHPKDFWP